MEKEMKMEPIVNRRKYPRHLALFSAKYIVKTGTFRDLIGNVSAGGIYIHTRRAIEDGQRITLRFPIIAFDQRPSVLGTVVRSQDQGFAVMFDKPIEERIPKDELYIACQRG
jgi:hypothetical protein